MRMSIIPAVATMTAGSGWQDHAVRVLRRQGYRATGPRAAVVAVLAAHDCCQTALEIHAALRRAGSRTGVASVYRALDLLTDLGLVQRVDVGGGAGYFEPVLPEGGHHHHVVCDDCGRVDPFVDPALEQAIERAAGQVGYDVAGHEVILRGSCEECAPASRAATG